MARILIAEDDPINRQAAVMVLFKAGHTVVAVKNGLEAVQELQDGPFDMVLMDVKMPVMDGLEATNVIRSFPEPLAIIPILAVTACVMPGDRERILSSGVDGYLSKPYLMRDILHAVQSLTGKWTAGNTMMPDQAPAFLSEVAWAS